MKTKEQKLKEIVSKFQKSQDDLAKKYGVKISIGFEDKEVVIADHRDENKEN